MTFWKQKTAFCSLAALLALGLLTGCGGGSAAVVSPAPTSAAPSQTPAPAVETPAEEKKIAEKGQVAVDWSHAPEGYLLAHRGESEKKWKFRVTKDTEYTYDLTGEGWTALPLSEGNGTYTAAVFEQTEGTSYLPVLTADFDVELTDPLSPFLRPNQQVDYAAAPLTIAKAAELTADAADDTEKTRKIYEFVSTTLRYDEEQAESVQSGYIPALDEVLRREKGICLDFAALMTAMLRSQGVPCKLAVGDAGSVYHAWTEVWNGETWVRYDPTFAASGKDVSGVEYVPKFYY